MLTDYLLFILSALAVAAVAFLYIHFLFHIIVGGENDFDADDGQTETPTAPGAAEGGTTVKDTKICPICFAGANDSVCYCIHEECAWWAEFANECSVPLIAGILADSTICQNVFTEPPKEET